MFIATHPTYPGCAYILENNRLFFLQSSDNALYIHAVEPNTDPYKTKDISEKAYANMAALFRVVTDAEQKPITRVNQLPADHILPEWLHALRIRNLNPTDHTNTEHLIHTTAPRFVANICPDNQDIATITPIDPLPNKRPALEAAEKFLATLPITK